MNKKALVITYHVKNSTRVGGFHYFIHYLSGAGYDVDWFTTPVSITWLYKKNDKENARNFIDLCKGISYQEGTSYIRHFTVPLWIPARVAKKFRMKIGDQYWPKWKSMRRKLNDSYNVILVEGVGCQYAEELRRAYPKARILYRPSDILRMFSDVKNPDAYERKMIEVADLTLCVDETCLKYYQGVAGKDARLVIQRNPLVARGDYERLKEYYPKFYEKKSVVYIGVSYVSMDMVEYAAKINKDATFYIIGPFHDVSHDNVVYTGTLRKKEYEEYISNASVGISPLNPEVFLSDLGIAAGYTRKIINYMKYLIPIVATCSSNYLNIPGFYCVDSKEEFSDAIKYCLRYKDEDRLALREGYLRAMQVFSEDEAKKSFLKYVEG